MKILTKAIRITIPFYFHYKAHYLKILWPIKIFSNTKIFKTIFSSYPSYLSSRNCLSPPTTIYEPSLPHWSLFYFSSADPKKAFVQFWS